MKRLLGFACVLVLGSIPAFAAKNSQTVNVPEAVTVGTTQIPAGDYKVTWSGSGSSVEVSFKQEGVRTPATATIQAKLVDENHNAPGVTIDSRNGVNTLEQIQLRHISLVLSSAPTSGQ